MTTPLLIFLVSLLLSAPWLPQAQAMRPGRVAELRRGTVEMFYHGFDNYMRIAFPEDELRPVSCVPLTRDNLNPRNIELNDVLGNYSLTLIDSLSTLAILASAPVEDGETGPKALRDFQDGIAALVEQYGDGRPGLSGKGQRGRGFDMDSKVQVFETVIRGVGGLLSAHLFAVGELPITGYVPPRAPSQPDEQQTPIQWPNGFVYDGQLLRLALDLATRLLPAFYTPTGMPYPRVNLRHGIPFYVNSPLHDDGEKNSSERRKTHGPPEITETCSAGAGSLVLEFTVLSRLTGDQRFEQLAKRAFWAVWYRRSDIGLIGAGVDAEQGRWIGAYSVIGAGADSFFEYALKTHILLSGHEIPNRTATAARPPAHHVLPMWTQDGTTGPLRELAWHDPNTRFPILSEVENAPDSFLDAWHLAHAAIKRHLYSDREHPHYVNVNLWTGSLAAQWIDSLGAYYSGLLVLAGEVDEAIETNLLYTAVWAKYAALPERWSVTGRSVEGGLGWWPLRPEFIESVYHIYRATKDPWYLYVGDMVQRDIKRRCRTSCGWAGLQNVVSGEKSDRMESFFLGETAKYMYLLYDDQHPLNSLDAAYVFTTEGHPLVLPKRRTRGGIKTATAAGDESQDSKIQEREPSGIPGVPEQDPTTGDIGIYGDEGFATTCPAPPQRDPLTGSAITGRSDLFHAAKMVQLQGKHDSTTVDGDDIEKYFVWTLPPSMLPHNGTSAKVQQPLELSLEFSVDSNAAAAAAASVGGLSRVAPNKIRVNNISGLKLLFRMEEAYGERTWQVVRVSGVPMGRDESIVLDRALISHISDPRFALVRDSALVKLHHLHHAAWLDEDGSSEEDGDQDDENDNERGRDRVAIIIPRGNKAQEGTIRADQATESSPRKGPHNHHHIPPQRLREAVTQGARAASSTGLTTLVKSFWRQIVSSLDGPAHETAAPGNKSRIQTSSPIFNVVLNSTGVTPTGLGAASLPPVDVLAGAVFPATGSVPLDMLPWRSVYAGGLACNVDENGDPAKPLPETAPLAMILVGGGSEAYTQITEAQQLGLTRRYVVESQGMRVRNVIIDDCDDL
ncbi:glycoside hydrolase family 47 protein [Ophiostoma piceae UAMH 11346]|uniref:alpha-1,2-Mannosidase n=1 Tax=Ophiostoma piceae (strain UAMH 11346) TaxID=1262450 RepID=S3C362_OPHP1|nr:glycoside hydrolase family 47 protein [Ophiostoma piceae UAMH 11346]